VINEGMQPAHSPDLNHYYFYLWGMLKDKVYVNNPHSPRELKENIQQEISIITRQQLCYVYKNRRSTL
jgi:hypothetical protein